MQDGDFGVWVWLKVRLSCRRAPVSTAGRGFRVILGRVKAADVR